MNMKTVFVVDDNPVNLATAKQALNGIYRVLTIPSAEKMFSLFSKITPDLILLDIEMPEMDGFAALKKLMENEQTAKIPVMFLTASTDSEMEAKGLALGAMDFISKPFSVPVLLNRIKNHLNIGDIVKKRTERIEQLQNGIVFTFANIVESRDKVTGGHITRTSKYIKSLLNAMIAKGVYLEELMDWDLDTAIISSRLHDVGKIVVSDLILNKQGKLTYEEFSEIKRHTTEGEKVIDQMIAQTGEAQFLHHAKIFAGAHHERWDGKGYPRGLREEEIPLQGRIMAIADVYDALVSERSYKPAFSSAEAAEMIKNDSGTAFDPLIVGVFDEIKGEFAEIAEKYKQGDDK
ncbi:MAG: response regulator [Fibromonadales bacterium]|nr:response regulator [Fibromonadales bacterium]